MAISRWLPLVLAGLLIGGPALADWKRDYVRAERAASDGNWSEAEALFRQAARSEPTPSERKRFEGVVFRDYAPHYWAGISAWRQGACDRAIDYWQDAANSAAVLSNIKDFKAQQDRGLAECQQTLARAAAPAQPTAPAAPVAAPAVATAPVSTPSVATPAPAPAQTQPSRPTQVAQQPSTTPVAPAPRPTAPASDLRPAPAPLVTALQAWLAGRYSDVLAVAPDSVSDARARAHLHLLRAAARHSESELGNASSLPAAQEEVRAARRAQATLTPDAALFSPRFRTFCEQTR
jgi:hypothetical protein